MKKSPVLGGAAVWEYRNRLHGYRCSHPNPSQALEANDEDHQDEDDYNHSTEHIGSDYRRFRKNVKG